MKKGGMAKSRRFLLGAASFLIGIAAGTINISATQEFGWFAVWGIFLVGILFYRYVWVWIFVVFFCVGIIRVIFLPNSTAFQEIHEKIVLEGTVVKEPDRRIDTVQYVIETQKGRFLVKQSNYPEYGYGEQVRLSCSSIQHPAPLEEFRYDMYLAKEGVYLVCRSPRMSKIYDASNNGNPVLYGVFAVKLLLAKKIEMLWHEPYASFVAGLLYGYRGGLGELSDLFMKTGLTHIVAISGYNISMLVLLCTSGMYAVGIRKRYAVWLVMVCIVLFVFFTGAGASIVRAGVMGVIVLVASSMGKKQQIAGLLLLSGSIMCAYNPLYLVWDAGFQLSYLSTIGLVYLNPKILRYATWVPEEFSLRESFVSTLSATAMTLPLSISLFGGISLVSIITNVLILWTIPYIMLVGFATILISILNSGFLISIGLVISYIGMTYILSVVDVSAALPFAYVALNMPFWIAILAYGALLWYAFKKTV